MVQTNFDIIKEVHDDDTTYILIKTNLGNFEGYAFLHPDDKEYESDFAGARVAEANAIIDYLNEFEHRLNIKLQAVNEMLSMAKKEKYSDMKTIALDYKEKIMMAKKDVKETRHYIKENLNSYLEARIKVLASIEEKHKQEQKNESIISKIKRKLNKNS